MWVPRNVSRVRNPNLMTVYGALVFFLKNIFHLWPIERIINIKKKNHSLAVGRNRMGLIYYITCHKISYVCVCV
jgi:hypothetical protein